MSLRLNKVRWKNHTSRIALPENDPAVVAAWDENQLIITDLIQMSLNKYEKAIIEQPLHYNLKNKRV